MNKLGLKEPGFENRRTFSKKAREKKLRLSTFPNHGQLNKRQNSSKIFDASEKSHVDNGFESREKFPSFLRAEVE